MPTSDGKRDHATRADTERKGYDRLREAGASHDFARARAEKASVLTHQGQDRINSDTARKGRGNR